MCCAVAYIEHFYRQLRGREVADFTPASCHGKTHQAHCGDVLGADGCLPIQTNLFLHYKPYLHSRAACTWKKMTLMQLGPPVILARLYF
jgi:hypothetical protein